MALYVVEVTRVFHFIIEAATQDSAAEIAAAEVSQRYDLGAVVMETSTTTEVNARPHATGAN